jgi:hypothetical protein
MTIKSYITDGDKVFRLEKASKPRKLPRGHKAYSRVTPKGKVAQVKEKPYDKKVKDFGGAEWGVTDISGKPVKEFTPTSELPDEKNKYEKDVYKDGDKWKFIIWEITPNGSRNQRAKDYGRSKKDIENKANTALTKLSKSKK